MLVPRINFGPKPDKQALLMASYRREVSKVITEKLKVLVASKMETAAQQVQDTSTTRCSASSLPSKICDEKPARKKRSLEQATKSKPKKLAKAEVPKQPAAKVPLIKQLITDDEMKQELRDFVFPIAIMLCTETNKLG